MRYRMITFGCQMNKKDSSMIHTILAEKNHRHVNDTEEADLIIINTCSVRDHAEKRAKSHIAALRRWHERGDRLLGVIGCMAQRVTHELVIEFPYIDFVLGPDTYRDISTIIDELRYKHSRLVKTDLGKEDYRGLYAGRAGLSDYVAIMRGCSNFCSYCIVPYVRGPARSRSPEDIIRESQQLVAQNVKEIVLIGQNVNEYHYGDVDLAGLLSRISQLPGLQRLRFLTSHPKDLDQSLIDAVKKNTRICEWFHLPLQSGSDRILEQMNRQYTVSQYRDIIRRIRETIPGAGITSDIIVGFPGETEAEFMDTINLVSEIRFDDAFTYRFSPRPGTQAARLPMLSEPVIKRRLHELIEVQNSIIKEKSHEMIGHRFEIMIEATAKHNKGTMRGRTRANKDVILRDKGEIGKIMDVAIVEVRGRTPVGVSIREAGAGI